MGEVLTDGFSDRGSIPLISTIENRNFQGIKPIARYCAIGFLRIYWQKSFNYKVNMSFLIKFFIL